MQHIWRLFSEYTKDFESLKISSEVHQQRNFLQMRELAAPRLWSFPAEKADCAANNNYSI